MTNNLKEEELSFINKALLQVNFSDAVELDVPNSISIYYMGLREDEFWNTFLQQYPRWKLYSHQQAEKDKWIIQLTLSCCPYCGSGKIYKNGGTFGGGDMGPNGEYGSNYVETCSCNECKEIFEL
ncbi:MAG: hypothetical protein WCO09_04105 [bacterium]